MPCLIPLCQNTRFLCKLTGILDFCQKIKCLQICARLCMAIIISIRSVKNQNENTKINVWYFAHWSVIIVKQLYRYINTSLEKSLRTLFPIFSIYLGMNERSTFFKWSLKNMSVVT